MSKLFGKNYLDELQEQKMLRIERTCFWALYWMLLAEMMLQLITSGDPASIIGECICFMIASFLMVGLCLKNNLWDRRLKADRKTNLIISLIAAVAVFFLNSTVMYAQMKEEVDQWQRLTGAAVAAVMTFLLVYGGLSILSSIYKKRIREEEEAEEE